MKNYIKEGDIVRVDFNGEQATLCFEAEVLRVPVATGDSWIFKELSGMKEGSIYYVSEGCTVSLLKYKNVEINLEPPPRPSPRSVKRGAGQ